MAKRILVPIGRRDRGEAIVPLVGAIARDTGATVRLLRVAPVPENVVSPQERVVAYADQEMTRLTHEGDEDLERVEAALPGVPVERVVRFGDPVDEILLEAEVFGAELIAMTSGRRGRLHAALVPDAADRVVARASVPVLVLRG